MDEFILLALLSGTFVALVAGPMGCFLVWRRMAYFGDTIAHSALLGLSISVMMDSQSPLIMAGVCALVAFSLIILQHREQKLASDTLLGILSHGSLALGLVLIALQENIRRDMMFFLIGDILGVVWQDFYYIIAMAVVCLGGMILIWRPLLAVTVHEDLANVDGVSIFRTKVIYMLLMAFLVAFAIKIVGVLLITALMIIPAATARMFANRPVQMAIMASLIGIVAVCGGLGASYYVDIPAGPAIVLAALTMFLLSRSFFKAQH